MTATILISFPLRSLACAMRKMVARKQSVRESDSYSLLFYCNRSLVWAMRKMLVRTQSVRESASKDCYCFYYTFLS